MPEDDAGRPADASLRRRVFWAVLAGSLLLVAASHASARWFAYPLEPGEPLVHGGYGLGLAAPAPAGEAPRVVLLGNSVYQREDTPRLMQRLAALRGQPLELLNLAQVGSGLEDYLVQAAWTADEPRDLTVVCLGYVSVCETTPRLRTDAAQYACDPRVAGRLPLSFYRRNFTASGAAASASAALLPHQRIDPILRYQLRESALARPAFLYDRLRFPTLNLGRNRINTRFLRGEASGFDWWSRPPEQGWRAACDELLALLGELGPVLLVWQEARPGPYPVDVVPSLQEVARAHGATFVDLSAAWSPERFRDPIHPTHEERPRQALRHLEAILAALGDASRAGD
jgi:hypothetical protein